LVTYARAKGFNLCRSCGFRFSESPLKSQVEFNIISESRKLLNPSADLTEGSRITTDFVVQEISNNSSFPIGENVSAHVASDSKSAKSLNKLCSYSSNRRLCAVLKEAKKLDTATENKTVAGDKKPLLDQQTQKGLIINFMLYMKKQGFRPTTIQSRAELVTNLLNQGVNINDPEDVKFAIADKKCGDGYKKNLVLAYDTLLKMQGIKWDAPKYKPSDRLPFIPLEIEIDQLISSVGRNLSLFLHVLKETGADPGEALAIEWIDVDREKKTITINHPVKGHKARIITVSRDLINRLDSIPKMNERVFKQKLASLQKNFEHQRKTALRKLNNPRLRKITFTTFRHWKATMEYHKTKDILWVMRLLGHNSLKTTLIYIDLEIALFKESNDDFTVKVAATLDEACKLLEVGFEYVCEMDDKKIFKKRK
jgi:integrase